MRNLEALCISEASTLENALISLKQSGAGIVCVRNSQDIVLGVITDGDIRSTLLNGGALHDLVGATMNKNFIYAKRGESKEAILKLLDSKIRQIPIIDDLGKLVDVAGPGYTENIGELVARAKAPARISLAGGGTDLTGYFTKFGGITLSATIAKFSHVSLKQRSDKKIIIKSNEKKIELVVDSINDLKYGTPVDLIIAGIKLIKPSYGFEIECVSDFPVESGLGGSSAVLAAMLGCFGQFDDIKLDPYEVAEKCFDIERVELGIPGGWQDQYATSFGGFNYIEFEKTRNHVTPLRVRDTIINELEARLFLCYTGAGHLGKEIQKITKNYCKDSELVCLGEKTKEIAMMMKKDILRGDLSRIGEMLHQTWQLKKSLNRNSTTQHLDDMYKCAIDAGADGGRLLGTGGGGYFLFSTKPFQKVAVIQALINRGYRVESLIFDGGGMKSWITKI